jgi:hypothetical protein
MKAQGDLVSTNTERPNGVGTCRTSDACALEKGASIADAMASATAASGSTPLPAAASSVSTLAADGADAALGGAGLPDTNLLWQEINIYCPGAEASGTTCITDDLLKQAIKAYFDPLTGYAVAVANTNVHPSVEDVVDDDLRAELSAPQNNDQACMSGTKYNVYLTTHDNDQVPILNAVWDNIAGDPSDFLAFLQEVQKTDPAGLAPAGVVCGLTIKRVQTASYPSAERMPAFKPQGLSLMGPSVFVGDSTSIAPITEVVKGEEYSMFVQNFPATSPVEVRLIHVSVCGVCVCVGGWVGVGDGGREGVCLCVCMLFFLPSLVSLCLLSVVSVYVIVSFLHLTYTHTIIY